MIMPPGHPLSERLDKLVCEASQMGFWINQAKMYTNRRHLTSMILRQRIIYNYQHGLDNTAAVKSFRDSFYDPTIVNATG